MARAALAVAAAAVVAAPVVRAQDPLAAVRADEARRVALVARCAPAVCAVMAMDEPGGGSGVVFDARGYVLTNYHVVGEPDPKWQPPQPPALPDTDLQAFRAQHPAADDAAVAAFTARWQDEWRREHAPRGRRHYRNKKVGLPDGELYEAVVLGIDPGSDLAVLRLLPKHAGQTWPHRPLGDSDAVRAGQPALAMGNPFVLATDFAPTVTFGVVSGVHRYQEGQGNRMLVYPDCIQVDAPVNPGNSGGPLFDERGDVIGINGRIAVGDRGRVNVGVGFAIASNQIRNFLGDLMAGRHAEHGTLDLSAWRAGQDRQQADPTLRGVYVQQIFKDAVAAAAGIGLGDELVRCDGLALRSPNELARQIGVLPAGAWVELAWRPRASEGFGALREAAVRLAALDTGSSRDGGGDDARLASADERRRARDAWLAQWPARDEPADAMVTWRVVAPEGFVVRALRHGERLRRDRGGFDWTDLGDARVDNGDGSDGSGFASDGNSPTMRDLTADERESLRRERACNPLLWPSTTVRARLAEALLLGGVHVLGAPALRFALPGDGGCEAWFFLDGTPAGCAFRDPVRKARVEWHVRGSAVRVVFDGKAQAGWRDSQRDVTAAEPALFGRPQ
ncbi:MAG: trypsin-like serine protease [Planctomycetes bacterium]|nr:trypsin-like serine protease [Planctomycetota bacterium]MBM3975185.1 trypsin-like serine protease [Planctomycetota bacterium]